MLHLHKSQWHVRLFFWALENWDAFSGCTSDARMTGRTNVCHFIRTIFVAAPLAFASHAVFAAAVLYVVVYFPVTRFGAVNYVSTLVIFGATVGTVFLIRWLVGLIPRRKPRAKPDKQPSEFGKKFSGFVDILIEWAVAQKRRVCSLIEISEGPQS